MRVWEKEAFSRPWSAQALKESLVRPEYVFLTAVEQEKVIGYCGAQAVLGEADITNITVFRRAGGRAQEQNFWMRWWRN